MDRREEKFDALYNEIEKDMTLLGNENRILKKILDNIGECRLNIVDHNVRRCDRD